MKIRQLTTENYPKAASLLTHAFAPRKHEDQLFDKLHAKEREMQEWVCIHRNSVIAYIGFTQAYDGRRPVGLHLTLLAVKPQMQGQGTGSELLRFALRQDAIRERTIFVISYPQFFKKFGFERCAMPTCPFDKGNAQFLSIRNDASKEYTVGYEPEFSTGKKR